MVLFGEWDIMKDYRLGDLNDTNKVIPQLIMDANVSDIACSGHGTFIFKTDGSLWAIGHNAHNRMGHNDRGNHATPQMVFSSGVQAVSGDAHSSFLKTDGSLWVAGKNKMGRVGYTG